MAMHAMAQGALEIIPLKHRTLDQMLPVLQPLLEPGATLTGQSGQLIVRTSPQNLVEIRQALDTIDQSSRRLQILVRFDDASDSASRDLAASGTISSRGSRVEVRGQDSQNAASERID